MFERSVSTLEIYATKYLRMEQIKYFKASLLQILLGPFLYTSSHIYLYFKAEMAF